VSVRDGRRRRRCIGWPSGVAPRRVHVATKALISSVVGPAATPHDELDHAPPFDPNGSRREARQPMLSAEEATGMRVLIVDDSRLARLTLRKALPADLLADVVEAADGNEALRYLEANDIDLMLLDLTLPGRDGYQVLKALQESGRTPPTIVVSADAQSLAAERVMRLGAVGFVKKSLSSKDLTEALQRAGLL
jgi:CheY-like chemotaxis protein